MKKLLALCLTVVLCLCCLTACELFEKDKGVTVKKYENCAVFIFDDFPLRETASFELERTDLGEGAIYYQVNLKQGALGISYKGSIIGVHQSLGEFTADDEMPINGSGGYIEGDKIEISFGSLSPVSGEIIIAFTEDALKAVHKDFELHEHTREMRSNEYAHWYVNTCGCETPENSAKHGDIDGDFLCDDCGYDMNEHEHTYEYNHDDIGHGWSYTCGCMTPPNFAQHFDGNGDGKCDEDSCGYKYAECDHQWDDGVEIEGGLGGYVMEYTCTLCGDKQRETITIIPPSGVSHSISYQSDRTKELLMEGFAPTEAKPGDSVVLRTNPIMDADLAFYANGVKLTQTHADSDYWEYVFIMPDEDVVITHEITDGSLPD